MYHLHIRSCVKVTNENEEWYCQICKHGTLVHGEEVHWKLGVVIAK